jgi:RNA polymerase sigma-54 factor
MWQLGFTGASQEVKIAAEMIIGNIDESGYLRASDEELMEAAKCDARTLRRALELVRGFDPPGVGAREIKECLALQIKALGLAATLVDDIVRESFHELEKKRIPVIAKLHGVSVEDAAAAVKIIEGLEPKPGRMYSNSVTSYVAPDVYLERVNDAWKIILNDEHIPHVRISSKYKDLLGNKKSFEKDERQFLVDKYRAAVWLLKSLDERNKTIYRVTDSILRHQAEFFNNGVQHLRPLNLRNISEDIGMHESNISRVTSNKYLSCPHGIFPFKYFFSSSLSGADGDVSSTTVKDTIKKLVEEENPLKPLTDQKIVEILNSRNITIARRTMAKYREELKIPPHTKRRKIN